MRILLVCDDFPSAFAGGTATSTMYLALGLGALGHDVVLAWPEDPEQLPLPNVRQIRIPGKKFQLDSKNHLVMALPITQATLPQNWIPEVVHSMQPTPISLALKWQTRRWGVPLLLSMHNLIEQTFSPFLQAPLSLWSPWMYRLADLTIVPSAFAARYANQHYRLKRHAEILSNSIDLTNLRSQIVLLERPTLQNRTIKLCSAISLLPYKNPMMMLEIIAALVTRGLDITLNLAGKGPMRPELEVKAAALGMSERVRFLGALEQPELLRLMQRSDAFLLTSRMEVQPMVLIEAKAMGTPAFVSDAALNGGKDLVRHGVDGLLFPVDDLEQAVQLIYQCLTQPEQLGRMAKAAYADAANYDMSAIAQTAIGVYQQAILELRQA